MLCNPGRSQRRSDAQPIGFVVADELLLDRIELELPLEDPGEGGGVAGDVRMAHDLGVGRRLAAGSDAVEEVPRVRGDVEPVLPLARRTSWISALSDAGWTSMPPLSPVSTQPSSPTKRTGQVPSDWTQPGRWPKGVCRKSSTSFTPLA